LPSSGHGWGHAFTEGLQPAASVASPMAVVVDLACPCVEARPLVAARIDARPDESRCRRSSGPPSPRTDECIRGQAIARRRRVASSSRRPSDRRRPNGSADESDRPWERFRESSGTRGSSPNARLHGALRADAIAVAVAGCVNCTRLTPAPRPSRSARRMRRENARAPSHWTFRSC
jgi:hypothetical protein